MSPKSQKPPDPRAKSDHSGTAAPDTISGLLLSLLFWLTLLVAAALFGVVGLSPKLLEQARLRGQFEVNQVQLVLVERQNEQLQRVVEAIRHDKEFAAEMTRVEFDAVGADEEIISVDTELRLVPQDLELSRIPATTPQPWYSSRMIPFVENDLLRTSLLGTAALLVIVSFTWFQPGIRHRVVRPAIPRRSFWQFVRARYIRAT